MPAGTLSVLYLGGTGTISASCVARSVATGRDVHVLNRGRTDLRALPEGARSLVADASDPASVREALGNRSFDVVVDFLSFGAADVERAVELFEGRAGQYVHISTASIYRKPARSVPVTESTPLENGFSQYARDKIAAERAVRAAYDERGFPATVVRPSHTYDDARPPLPGMWTEVERMLQGRPVLAPGDGTSLWTLTHAEDFAVGLDGLLGNRQAVGEAFHITSDEALPWDEIYRTLGAALGVEPKIVHVPADFLPLAAPDWMWSDFIVGDLRHSAVLDNTKIRRFVPDFHPRVTWSEGARRLVRWRAEHPQEAVAEPAVDAVLERLVQGYHRAREIFASLAPYPSGAGR